MISLVFFLVLMTNYPNIIYKLLSVIILRFEGGKIPMDEKKKKILDTIGIITFMIIGGILGGLTMEWLF